jgi:hypothetical protein
MSAPVEHELMILNRDIGRYGELSGKLPEDILVKQGGKLAMHLSDRLKKFSPSKGFVTRERLAALKEGQGVKVRPAAYRSTYAKYGARTDLSTRATIFGKRGKATNARGLNLQALAVKRELAIREGGRGFISFAARAGARYGNLSGLKPGQKLALRSRYGSYLASVGLQTRVGSGELVFLWAGSDHASQVAKVLQQARAQGEIVGAIAETSADIRAYVPKKTRDDAKGCFR